VAESPPKSGGPTLPSRLAPLVLGLAVLAVVILLATSGGNPPYSLQLTVPEATGVIPGERVVQGGLTAGTIESANVTANGEAHLVLGIDRQFWPIPSDSWLVLRMGGTIKYTDRYVQIVRGRSTTGFADSARVPAAQFVTPVEYDTVFNTFNAPTRAALKTTLDNAGPLFSQAAPAIRRALGDASPALSQADAVFRDADAEQGSLGVLLNSTGQLSNAIAASNPGLQTMLTGLANTFSSASSESGNLAHAISSAPASFDAVIRAANHVSSTLPLVATLTHVLNPGIAQLQSIASPLDSTLHELVNVEPTAVATLQTIRDAGPHLIALTNSARTTLMPRLGSISRQAAKQLNCIRPYTPEGVSMIQEFVNGLQADGPATPRIHVLHALITAMPFPNDMPIDMQQLTQLFPGMHMDYPAVPGMSFNQPWFQPQCGVTPNALNPADDSEAHTFDPAGSKVFPYPSH
jgi:ABC-type transporter Mla subunit MlaD